MPTAKRRLQPGVIQRLLDQPYRFELVQALRMLELWVKRNGESGEHALAHYVRFHNSLSMCFPPSQIEAFTPVSVVEIDSAEKLQASMAAGQLKRLEITPAFMSFFGAGGVLPHHYTQAVAQQIRFRKFAGTRAFFDIFYNRVMLLHYQAWGKYRIQYDHAKTLPLQLSLAGQVARPETGNASSVLNEDVRARYAAILRHRPASARLIQNVLSEYLGVPVKLEQFVGAWDVLEEQEHCKLGAQNATLGGGAMLGGRCWERNKRIRLHIGPLALVDYEKFLPGASGVTALKQVLALFSTPGVSFDMRLILRASDVKPVCLNASGDARLGMTTFLAPRADTDHRDDALFELTL